MGACLCFSEDCQILAPLALWATSTNQPLNKPTNRLRSLTSRTAIGTLNSPSLPAVYQDSAGYATYFTTLYKISTVHLVRKIYDLKGLNLWKYCMLSHAPEKPQCPDSLRLPQWSGFDGDHVQMCIILIFPRYHILNYKLGRLPGTGEERINQEGEQTLIRWEMEKQGVPFQGPPLPAFIPPQPQYTDKCWELWLGQINPCTAL